MKKYPSLAKVLLQVEAVLLDSPNHGTALGQNAYKIRLRISSKGKGKSGGARVISFVETVVIGTVQATSEEVTVNLLTIYDKTRTASISDKELRELLSALKE